MGGAPTSDLLDVCCMHHYYTLLHPSFSSSASAPYSAGVNISFGSSVFCGSESLGQRLQAIFATIIGTRYRTTRAVKPFAVLCVIVPLVDDTLILLGVTVGLVMNTPVGIRTPIYSTRILQSDARR